ncbi:glycosyltransferase family 1 protein [Peribacillus simplex]
MDPIRILHILNSMNRGGSETMIMNYYRNIDRKKVQFDFLLTAQEKSDYEDEIISLGGNIHRVPPIQMKSIYKFFVQLNEFYKQNSGYRIVHSHRSSVSSLFLLLAKRNNIPIRIAHSHSSKSELGVKGRIRNALMLPLKYSCTDMFACGQVAGEWLFGKEKNDTFTIVNNAIEAKEFVYNPTTRDKLRNELNISEKFVLGHVGRFSHPKNHEFLIDIFYEVYKKNSNSVLLLVGSGELEEAIRKKVEMLGLTHVVKFLGLRLDIPHILQTFDVFVFPSHFEGLPVVTIESQASGLKTIVSSDITKEIQITDLVKSISLSDSPELWAKYILQWENGYERKDTYIKIEESGYDIKQEVKKLEKFYMQSYERVK